MYGPPDNNVLAQQVEARGGVPRVLRRGNWRHPLCDDYGEERSKVWWACVISISVWEFEGVNGALAKSIPDRSVLGDDRSAWWSRNGCDVDPRDDEDGARVSAGQRSPSAVHLGPTHGRSPWATPTATIEGADSATHSEAESATGVHDSRPRTPSTARMPGSAASNPPGTAVRPAWPR